MLCELNKLNCVMQTQWREGFRKPLLIHSCFINKSERHNVLNPFTDDSNLLYHMSVRLWLMKCWTAILSESFADDTIIINRLMSTDAQQFTATRTARLQPWWWRPDEAGTACELLPTDTRVAAAVGGWHCQVHCWWWELMKAWQSL